MEGRSALPKEMGRRLSGAAERLAAVEQVFVSDHKSAPATQALKNHHNQVKKRKICRILTQTARLVSSPPPIRTRRTGLEKAPHHR